MRRKEKRELAVQGVIILACNITVFLAISVFVGLTGSLDCDLITMKQFDLSALASFAVGGLALFIRYNAECAVANIKARHRRGVIGNRSKFDRDMIEYRRAL